MNRTRSRGFSLLELMAVLAILAVLSTVAIFSYKSYLRRARNAEGIAFLMDIKMKQETYFMAYSRYVSTADTPDGLYPETFIYVPSPWMPSSDPWDCATSSHKAIVGFCALGITPTSPETFFQYVTIGWEPGKEVPSPGPKGPWIQDARRRWWFARARGFAGADNTQPFEYRISSEFAQIAEIPPD